MAAQAALDRRRVLHDVEEQPLRALAVAALGQGAALVTQGLAEGPDGADEDQEEQHRQREAAVAADEAHRLAPQGVGERADRVAVLEVAQVRHQRGDAGVAGAGVLRGRAGHGGAQLRGDGDARVGVAQGGQLAGDRGEEHGADGLAAAGGGQRDDLEEHHAERVDVGALVEGLGGGLLRGHVGRRAHDAGLLRRAGHAARQRAARARAGEQLADAPVDDVDLVEAPEHDVVEFVIVMHQRRRWRVGRQTINQPF